MPRSACSSTQSDQDLRYALAELNCWILNKLTNRESLDQSARMPMLIWAVFIRIRHKRPFFCGPAHLTEYVGQRGLVAYFAG